MVKSRLRIIKENYPYFLQQLFTLGDENEANVTVINKGIFNDNSDSLLSRLNKDVIEESPDYAIVAIGGNDCNFKWDEVAENPDKEHQPIVPIERYLDNIKTMISLIKKSNITPIVITLPPLDPVRYYQSIAKTYGNSVSHWISTLGGIEHWHGLYNRSLNKIVDELEVIKIDVRTAIKQAGDLFDLISEDGIHLTSEGYKALSTEVYKYLSNFTDMKKPQQI
ncbi:lysophospholipase L1-like esterase [Paenibacillus sediminis]|uniref:Lysophospholipase L1-like esterase n=2 Tax=Paenibacillus sediminis TaxID=664909 RepID=A0ABS4H4L5_9BACL|nr:lysophospholipase L1-like esterase [Paenibacillus sediminis]